MSVPKWLIGMTHLSALAFVEGALPSPPFKCECSGNTTDEDAAPPELYLPSELKARVHAPHKCPGDFGLHRYKVHGTGETRVLCSACVQPGDVAIESH